MRKNPVNVSNLVEKINKLKGIDGLYYGAVLEDAVASVNQGDNATLEGEDERTLSKAVVVLLRSKDAEKGRIARELKAFVDKYKS